MKRLIILSMALMLAVAMFSGCMNSNNNGPNLPVTQTTPEPVEDQSDPSTIVMATINGTEIIYLSDYLSLWENYCYQYGIDESIIEDPQYAEDIRNLQDQIINSIVWERIMKLKLIELGYYDLSASDMAKAEADKETFIDTYMASYQEQIDEELGDDYTDSEYNLVILKYRQTLLDALSMTEDELLQFNIGDIAMENAMDELIPPMTPTDDDIKAQYDTYVERDRTEMESNPTSYETYILQYGYELYYIPEGYRTIKQVLIGIPRDTTIEINTLREEDNVVAADELLKEALLEVEAEANEVMAKLTAEEITFDEAIEQYNDDPGMDDGGEGYPVHTDSATYVKSFTAGALALTEVGELSPLIETDYGYHILQYTADMVPGPVDYDSVYQTIYDELLPTLQESAWADLVSSWIPDFEIEFNTDIS